MSKNTDSTAGGAMPDSDQANIDDAFGQTRLLLIAAGKLAEDMDDTAGYALKSVLGAAEEKFTVALDWYEDEAWEERKAAPEPIARQSEPASSSPRPPLSALIEAHRAAEAVFRDHVDALELAERPDKTISIPGTLGKPVPVTGGPEELIKRVEAAVELQRDETARVSKLYPDLGEAIRNRLETERAAAMARIEEAFAGYRAAKDAYDAANAASDDILLQICAFRCTSLEEVAVKIRYLAGLGNMLEPDQGTAFYASFLPEGEEIEPFV
jgi:hypothetical protein